MLCAEAAAILWFGRRTPTHEVCTKVANTERVPPLLPQLFCFLLLQVYFMVDFWHDAAAFFYYLVMNIASLMMFTSFGFFLVCATPIVELAQLFSR